MIVGTLEKNRLKRLIKKAESQLYAVNVRTTMLKDTLYAIRKEVQQLYEIILEEEDKDGRHSQTRP